jgi:aminoglycoside 6'-N-acetyltransferase
MGQNGQAASLGPRFAFRPLGAGDLPLVRIWLHAPHVRPWFGEPQVWLDEIQETLSEGWITHFIALLPDGPAGFAQHYDCASAPVGPWSGGPPGTLGIDHMLGRAELLGRGLGARLIGDFLARVEADLGSRRIIADPTAENLRSIRALAANGFFFEPATGLYVREALSPR